jgi:hypothetical protein
MERFITQIGGLWARTPRNGKMLVLGLGVALPAAGMVARTAEQTEPQPTVEEKVAEARAVEGPVAQLWKARALERERVKLAEVFAQDFQIPAELAAQIHTIALEEEIEPRMAFGLVRTESAFTRTAVSHKGAVGLTQLLPSTARWMEPGITRADLFHTQTNLRIGFKYLRYLMEKYDGDERLALTAYNRGPGTVDRLVRRGRNPENGYATKVLSPKKGRRI